MNYVAKVSLHSSNGSITVKNILKTLAFTTVFASCGLLWEYRNIHEIEGMEWHKSDVQSFEYTAETATNLNVLILIRHVHGIPFPSIPLRLIIKKDGQQISNSAVKILVMDNSKQYVGQGSGDLWDIEHLAFENMAFDAGTYTIELTHAMQRESIPLIMEVGIQLEKSE